MGDHSETVDIEFDPNKISYTSLLEKFWKWHDPTSSHNRQYMSAIFCHGDSQKREAQQSQVEAQKDLARPIVTLIMEAGPFYNADDYHQKYMVRQHPQILEKLALTDEELISSPAASKLNSYLGGYGTEESFAKDCEELQLSPTIVSYVREVMRKKSRR